MAIKLVCIVEKSAWAESKMLMSSMNTIWYIVIWQKACLSAKLVPDTVKTLMTSTLSTLAFTFALMIGTTNFVHELSFSASGVCLELACRSLTDELQMLMQIDTRSISIHLIKLIRHLPKALLRQSPGPGEVWPTPAMSLLLVNDQGCSVQIAVMLSFPKESRGMGQSTQVAYTFCAVQHGIR